MRQRTRLRLRSLVVAASVAAVTACDERLADFAGPTQNLAPTFASIQRDIFQAGDSTGRVSCASCHNPRGIAFRTTRLDLSTDTAYASLVGVPSVQRRNILLVAPGDPDNSYLVHKIEGRSGIDGDRMPQTPPFLTNGQVQIIRRWIAVGAPRN